MFLCNRAFIFREATLPYLFYLYGSLTILFYTPGNNRNLLVLIEIVKFRILLS